MTAAVGQYTATRRRELELSGAEHQRAGGGSRVVCTDGQWSVVQSGGMLSDRMQVVHTDGRGGLRSQPVSVWFGAPLAMGWREDVLYPSVPSAASDARAPSRPVLRVRRWPRHDHLDRRSSSPKTRMLEPPQRLAPVLRGAVADRVVGRQSVQSRCWNTSSQSSSGLCQYAGLGFHTSHVPTRARAMLTRRLLPGTSGAG